jgi:hypothetical protein
MGNAHTAAVLALIASVCVTDPSSSRSIARPNSWIALQFGGCKQPDDGNFSLRIRMAWHLRWLMGQMPGLRAAQS